MEFRFFLINYAPYVIMGLGLIIILICYFFDIDWMKSKDVKLALEAAEQLKGKEISDEDFAGYFKEEVRATALAVREELGAVEKLKGGEVLGKECIPPDFQPYFRLLDYYDSMAMVELILRLEEKFGIKTKDEELWKADTIEKLVNYIYELRGKNGDGNLTT